MRRNPWRLAIVAVLASAAAAGAAGRRCGPCAVPLEARAEDTSNPDHVIGDGTPASCTSQAVVATIAQGGIITFDCGPEPVTIVLQETAKIYNDTGPEIVIDGGGRVILDGGGARRILYMNTCDPELHWTTSHCDNQDHPRLTLQNLAFAHGDSTGATPDGGGAVFARGGRLKVVNCRFENNLCDPLGPDVGGAALRAFDQYEDLPLYVVASTFGGAPELGNACANGGALSAIGVSYTLLNSVISFNEATGYGANPPQPGTPGGGSGGAIYNDGNTFHLTVCGSLLHDNHANEGGGAIFFVSNDLTGTLTIADSAIWNCPSDGFWTPPWPWLFYLGQGPPQISGTTYSPASDLFCDGFESGDGSGWDGVVP